MKINPKFSGQGIKDKVRLIKAKWLSFPEPRMLYREFRNCTLERAMELHKGQKKVVAQCKREVIKEQGSSHDILTKIIGDRQLALARKFYKGTK